MLVSYERRKTNWQYVNHETETMSLGGSEQSGFHVAPETSVYQYTNWRAAVGGL
jgi:hypothetical protein